MLSKKEVIRRLQEKYGYNRFIGELAPFAIRNARAGTPLPADEVFAYVGHGSGRLRQIKASGYNLRICTDFSLPEVLLELGLDGVRVVDPGLETMDKIEASLNDLWDVYKPAAQSVADWTRVIAWGVTVSGQAFSACSYHELPQYTFLTNWAWRFLPPEIMFERENSYSFQESIYHESIHQALCHTIELEPIFTCSLQAANEMKVKIPWRGVSWPMEQVVHGYFVYHKISKMRKHVIEQEKIDAPYLEKLKRELPEAIESERILLEAINTHYHMFSEYGRDIIQALKCASHVSL